MNTTILNRLTPIVMIAAALSAAFMVRSAHAAPVEAKHVVTLPMVMVTGKRIVDAPASVVVMPRVVVTGHRIEGAAPTHRAETSPRRDVWVAAR